MNRRGSKYSAVPLRAACSNDQLQGHQVRKARQPESPEWSHLNKGFQELPADQTGYSQTSRQTLWCNRPLFPMKKFEPRHYIPEIRLKYRNLRIRSKPGYDQQL